MAKKKTTNPSTAAKTRKPSKKSPSKKSPPKQHDHEHDYHGAREEEVELDGTESKAIDLVLDSDAMRNALETEVNTVVSQAVRKICKRTGFRSPPTRPRTWPWCSLATNVLCKGDIEARLRKRAFPRSLPHTPRLRVGLQRSGRV